jgi:hypothetical protein
VSRSIVVCQKDSPTEIRNKFCLLLRSLSPIGFLFEIRTCSPQQVVSRPDWPVQIDKLTAAEAMQSVYMNTKEIV